MSFDSTKFSWKRHILSIFLATILCAFFVQFVFNYHLICRSYSLFNAISSNNNIQEMKEYEYKPLLFTISNNGYTDFTKNWIINLQKNNITNYCVMCTDENCFDKLSLFNKNNSIGQIRYYHHENETFTLRITRYFHSFGHIGFSEITKIRPTILRLLYNEYYNKYQNNITLNNNSNVIIDSLLYLDADMGIFRNFLFEFEKNDVYGKYGLLFQHDVNSQVCSCIIYISFDQQRVYHNEILKFLNQWETECANNTIYNDQKALNNIMKNPIYDIHIGFVNETKFCSGWRIKDKTYIYFQNEYLKQVNLVHANWVEGLSAKKSLLKKVNLWYLE
eukprot:244231_1